jgi:serine/threonine protein kinase
MLDLCTNTVSKGESGCIRCIDEPLIDMAKHGEIEVVPYENDKGNNYTDASVFFKHLSENNICIKIFFPDALMSHKLVGQSGFDREYKTILILKELGEFVENHTTYESYNHNYGFKLIFKHGVKVDEHVIHDINVVLVKLCLNSRDTIFASTFNSSVFKKHIEEALKMLHSNGYCHRDLHIGNVVLCIDKTPRYKLIDFEHMSTCNAMEQKEEAESIEHIIDAFASHQRRSKLGGKTKHKNHKKQKKQKKQKKTKKSRKVNSCCR